MPYRILIITGLSLLLGACMHANKPITIHNRCSRELNTARELLSKNAKTTDLENLHLARNLIRAAGIARQQQDFIQCLEKSSRAKNLLTLPEQTVNDQSGD